MHAQTEQRPSVISLSWPCLCLGTTPIDIAQTDREKSALYSKTAPKDVHHLFMTDRTPKQYEGFNYEKSKSKGLQ
jgi:hypothetical protein